MKIYLYIYGILILLFIAYNFWFRVQDSALHAVINILAVSILFLYIAYIAFTVLKKLKNK